MPDKFTNNDDTIDTRDIIEEIEELKAQIEEYEEENSEEKLEENYSYHDTQRELETLKELIDDIGENAPAGVTLINEDYFEEFAEEFACDIGAIQRGTVWPANCINWGQAADELQQDYTTVYYDGQAFYYN